MTPDQLLDQAYRFFAEGKFADARQTAISALQDGADAAEALRLVRFLDEIESGTEIVTGFETGDWLFEEIVEEGAFGKSSSAASSPVDGTEPITRAMPTVPLFGTPPLGVQALANEPTLESLVGSLQQIPRVSADLSNLENKAIDSRAAFLLSRIDGRLSFDQVLDVAGMSREEASRILARLVSAGILRPL